MWGQLAARRHGFIALLRRKLRGAPDSDPAWFCASYLRAASECGPPAHLLRSLTRVPLKLRFCRLTNYGDGSALVTAVSGGMTLRSVMFTCWRAYFGPVVVVTLLVPTSRVLVSPGSTDSLSRIVVAGKPRSVLTQTLPSRPDLRPDFLEPLPGGVCAAVFPKASMRAQLVPPCCCQPVNVHWASYFTRVLRPVMGVSPCSFHSSPTRTGAAGRK